MPSDVGESHEQSLADKSDQSAPPSKGCGLSGTVKHGELVNVHPPYTGRSAHGRWARFNIRVASKRDTAVRMFTDWFAKHTKENV